MDSIWKIFVNSFAAKDLTKGPVLRGILQFFWPIALSLLFQQVYALVDSMIVGQTLGDVEVAAVNNATNVFFLFINFAIGCMSGFSVLISEYIGAKDIDRTRRCIVNQIYLSLIIGAIITIGGILLIDPLLAWIGIAPNAADLTQQGIYDNARTYLLVLIGGAITQIFYNHIVSTLRSIGDSFTPFVFLLASTALNIALDLIFIEVCHYGVAGAAFATVLAQGLAAVACYLYAYYRYPKLRPQKEDWRWDHRSNMESLKNGLPMAFSYSILAIGIIVMQASVYRFDINPSGVAINGLPAQLGYGTGCKVINFLMAPLNALGAAMISFHSQNLGAKNLERIKKGFKASFLIGIILYLLVAVVGLLLTIGGAYQYFFLSADKISEASITYGNAYIYVAVPNFIFLLILFLLRNTLQGLEKPLINFLAGVAELLARVIVCSYLPMLLNGMATTNSESSLLAYIGAALGDPLAWVGACLTMLVPCLLSIYGKNNAVKKQQEKTNGIGR